VTGPSRRRVLAAGLVLLAARPAYAEPIPLARLSTYLNGIGTLRARFSQINADGDPPPGAGAVRL